MLVMLSGSGRTLLNLHEAIGRGELRARIGMVVCSRQCLGVTRAQELGLRTIVEQTDLSGSRLESLARESGASLVVLAGYLRRLGITASLKWKIVNIHPALLPSFGGAGMYGERVHQAVIDAGCKVSGCTVHLCDDEYDRGPIIVQRTCEVREDDTAHTLAARVFEQECLAYPEALRLLLDGRVRIEQAGNLHRARIV